MHSVTVVYLARALDRRWAGRRVQAVTFDRTVRSVAIAVEGSPPLDFPLAGEQLAPRELVEPPPDTLHVAGWRLVSVTAPTDERRLTVRFEREGKFRGSPTRSAVLDVSFIPTARGARLHGDPGDSRIGARHCSGGDGCIRR